MPKATFEQYWRLRLESEFNAALPGGGADWNIGGNGGGVNGWFDLPVQRESDGLQPKTAVIYPSTASGNRAMNAALPLAGADLAELGSLEFAIYPELVDRMFLMTFGDVDRTITPGVAALAATAFASVSTLDTQPDGTEQLEFTVASSTASSAAAIIIEVDAVAVETITIGTNAGTVDGLYYSKGGYNSTVTFSISGTITAGMVTIAGIDSVSSVFTAGEENPNGVIEQGGRPEAGSGNSEFMPGITIPTLVLNYDRSAPDNLLMANATIQGLRPTLATAGVNANDAASFYRPIAGWNAAITVDAGAYCEVVNSSITLQPNNALYDVTCGSQSPQGSQEGEFEVFGTMTILPADETRWDDYRNNTVRDVELTFSTPIFIVDTVPYSVKLEFTQMTFSDYSRNRQDPNLGAELAFRAIFNDTDAGPCKLTTVSRMPV